MGEEVRLESGSSRSLAAYHAAAAGDRRPGVVVIHEIYGLTPAVREVADRFAGAGYDALAVDLFSAGARPVCLARIIAGIALRPLKGGVVADLRAALAHLGAQPGVDSARLGVIGFCMGGSYALQLACVDGGAKAASVFYGGNPRPLSAVARACPVVGSYPGSDYTARAGRRLDEALDRYSVEHDIRVYPGARHSFFDPHNERAHDPQAAADSWRRTLEFFALHLGPAGA